MLIVAVFIFSTVVALFFIIYHFFGNAELRKKVANFPGPKSYPLLGCAHIFTGNTEDILDKVMNVCNEYPSPVRIELGPRIFICISDPEQIKTVLMSPKALDKDDIYKLSDPWLGGGMFTAPASTWRVHRKLLQPAFNLKVLQSFVNIFEKHAKILTEKMSAHVDGEEFHFFPYISSCTFNSICESSLGLFVTSETERTIRYIEAVESAIDAILTRALKVWLYPDVIFNLTKTSKVFYESIEYMRSVSNFIIHKRRKDYQNEGYDKNQILGEKKPFLDLIMELSDNGKRFSNEEIRQEVDTLLFGGFETSANVLCFVLLMLASHLDVQDKVYEELYNLYGSKNSEEFPVTWEDLPQLEYLERVIKETMRLFPVTPFIARKISDDLNIGEYTIPKGCSVAIALLKLHRDEKYWPDPLKFDPDRFLSDEVNKRHLFTYLPFSSGPRNCIGLLYAMMTMKVILATVLRKYIFKVDNIKPVKDIRLKINILLKPVEHITMRIEKRVK